MAVETITETVQYLTFNLDQELFALDIGKVREVLDFTSVTKVPGTPDFMQGVINLRGSVVPVLDLHLKFGMNGTERTVNTCVIITEIELEGETLVMGAMADAVQEVLDLEPEQIEPPPRIGTNLNVDFIKGMGKHNEQFIIILDIDRIFSSHELDAVQEMEDAAAVNA
ncbi:chemotaxis protein CheW [Geomonas nitrogeniifigens]|uniref:Chemotaxis protein CheW n=1 Tax=Geomonas diazotrophica TaxID=2843197 RepID=A0ABX8JN35_9BACT|nr:chemotaxis protein CheW [Geomonas nitrogeniifigens]QWV98501.1 chemotaxis protein CheW [Geomonas nitrogeniifigens]